MDKYKPFLSECVSLKMKKTKKAMMRMIANAAPAIVVKSVDMSTIMNITIRDVDEKVF
jgi:hypothetical protein